MLKTYIEFFYHGSFISESSIKQVADRSAPPEMPPGAYGYRFFSREEVELDGEVLRGAAKDYSPMTYFGRVLTLEDVKALEPQSDYKILVSNMTINSWPRVVHTNGRYLKLSDGDIVLPESADKAG